MMHIPRRGDGPWLPIDSDSPQGQDILGLTHRPVCPSREALQCVLQIKTDTVPSDGSSRQWAPGWIPLQQGMDNHGHRRPQYA